jgi:hypothetical protein
MKKALVLLTVILLYNCSYGQMGEWTWMNGNNFVNSLGHYGTQGVFNANNKPPGLYEPCEWTDKEGNFWLFGGVDTLGACSDLWEFKANINQWAWIKGSGIVNQSGNYGNLTVASLANNPGGRCSNPSWVDTTGDLWMFGGFGYDINGNCHYLNDLWRYNIATNEWTWMNGMNTVDDTGNYGAITIHATTNKPPARDETNASWTDSNNNLWLFGGRSFLNNFSLSDLWKYDSFLQEWVWMKGANTANQLPVYGTQGIPDQANDPGGRWCYSKWKDSSGNFWIFGAGATMVGSYNDVWRFNPITLEWTWIKGPNFANDTGTIGTRCIGNLTLNPSGRSENRACWARNCENFICFGGSTPFGYTNDLWNYNVGNNEWVNVSINQYGNYGTILVSSPTNFPPIRMGSIGWSDSLGNLWMFGGMNHNSQTFNDMWRFIPDTTCPYLCNITTGNHSPKSTPSQISLSPNPFTTTTTLTLQGTYHNASLFIYNLLGQELKSIPVGTNTQLTINREHLPAGMYFYKVIDENKEVIGIGKMIVE